MPNELTTNLKASPALSKALESTRRMTGLGGTDQIDFKETWNLPKDVSSIKDEAAALLEDAEAALKPATPDVFRQWMLWLGVACKGKLSEAEAESKIKAYSIIVPAMVCCTESSILRASRKFKTYGFPSLGELDEFFEDESRPFVQRADRLRMIADARVELPHKVVRETQEERTNHGAKVMADLRRKMKF